MTDTTDEPDDDRTFDEPARGEHVSYHDMGGATPLAVSIATAIGQVSGTDPIELPPLGRTVAVDFDALDALFTPDTAGTAATTITAGADSERSRTLVRFFYHGYEVFVHGDGRIRVRETE